MIQINPFARDHVRIEWEEGSNRQEITLFINGWRLCSVKVSDISPQAREYLFEETKA